MNALFSDSFCASPQDVSDPSTPEFFFVVLCLSVRGIQPHAYLRFVKEVQWLPVTDLYFMAIHGRGAIFNSSSSSVLLRKLNFVFKISSNTLPSVVSIILGFFACL